MTKNKEVDINVDIPVVPEEEIEIPEEILEQIPEVEVADDEESSLLTKEEKNKLAGQNEALVHFIAQKFSNTGISYDELVDVGFFGLAKALNAFKKSKGVKFSTYAYNCIYNEILFSLRKEKKHKENNVSINTPVSTDKNGNVLDLSSKISSEDYGERSIEEQAIISEATQFVRTIVSELPPIEQQIIKERFGIDNSPIRTQKEIADEIGMSQANISKLEKTILSKISRILYVRYGIRNFEI